MLAGLLSSILWFIGSFLVGWFIGSILGGFLGGIVDFIESILEAIPIPKIFTRLLIIVGSGLLVLFLAEDRFWFWILVAWWAFYLHVAHYGDEVGGE